MTSILNVPIDSDERATAEHIFSAMGMDIITGINIYLKKVVADRKIPFEISDNSNYENDIFYSESNVKYLEGIMNDIKNGKAHLSEHELIEVD